MKKSRKADTTVDSGVDRRKTDPRRVNDRDRTVIGDVDGGDRTARRDAAPREPVRGMWVGETEIGPTNDPND